MGLLFSFQANIDSIKEKVRKIFKAAGFDEKQSLEPRPAEINQVLHDFNRRKIFLLKDDNMQERKFESEQDVENVLTEVAQNNSTMTTYLKQYAHQGGFLDSGRFLFKFFFSGMPPLNAEGDVTLHDCDAESTFEVKPDGSIEFTEKFQVSGYDYMVKNSNGDLDTVRYELPKGDMLATISIKSTITSCNSNITHKLEEVNVEVHHSDATKLFKDRRNLIDKIITLMKDFFNRLSTKASSPSPAKNKL